MSETGGESVKRSKTAIAKSLLHRDRSKAASTNGSDTSSIADSKAYQRSAPHLDPRASLSVPSTGLGTGTSRVSMIDVANSAQREPLDELNASPNSKPSVQQSVRMFKLFEVLRTGNAAAIEAAILSDTRGTSETNLDDTTVLHLAIQCADPTVVEQILGISKRDSAVKIDVNAVDRDGNTPLHLASSLARTGTVRLLLDHPDINESIVNYQGKSALDLARTPEIFQQLQLSRSLFIDDTIKTLHSLVAKQQYDALEKLLEDERVSSTLDVNGIENATDPATVESGGTLLHEAARTKDTRLMQILLLNGADPFRRDRKGRLPQNVTKDDRTKAILKRSPAAAAAQRGIQEKTILGTGHGISADGTPGGKDAREMKGYLKKWTNYTSGYKLRWFVLEDGVMSYYKHQDDAGSACRGAINMRIASLHMDAQDKTRFEVHGKSSVKYHLKANHVVEAKRWFWALNNAIQWSKDEAKQQARQNQQKPELLSAKNLAPNAAPLGSTSSRVSFQESTRSVSHIPGDEEASVQGSRGLGQTVYSQGHPRSGTKTTSGKNPGIDEDDDDDFADDYSSRDVQPASKDAFTITAQSASLQLNLLAQVSAALQIEGKKETAPRISEASISQALSTYESGVASLQGLVNDLLKISRDRDAHWQYRLDREANMRRLWEDSMAKVAREQEQLQGQIEESEEKRKRTKRALKDVLEGQGTSDDATVGKNAPVENASRSPEQNADPVAVRKPVLVDIADLSESDEDDDEEFFDAVDAGQVEVVDAKAEAHGKMLQATENDGSSAQDARDVRRKEVEVAFHGYEDPIRTRLKMDADDRPKISLWGILKSMIGKDMTKMTLPVSFNEPTSLLQRVTEDMEYADLLDFAADRPESTERMVYVAAFAASEYASTVGRIAKPFNPLLGETYEYVRPDKGYRFFVEQVSHHPPIGAAWAEAAKWDYFGESALKSKFYGKSFEINLLGTWFLKLRPAPTAENPEPAEELYTWKKVTSSVVGIITGNPTVDNYGPMEIRNHMTGDTCILDFKQRSWKASSAYQVSGKVVGADSKTRWSIGGRWNDKLYARKTPGFEDSGLGLLANKPGSGTTYANRADPTQAFLVWQANARPANMPFNLTNFVVTFMSLPDGLRAFLPPTDTRFRPDQRAMEDGEYDLAASEKNRVEEGQRARRKKREESGDGYAPRWFTRQVCDTTGEEFWKFDREYWTVRKNVGLHNGSWDRVEEIF